MELDARAARIAAQQLGLLLHAQALNIGYSPRQIRTRLASGAWRLIRKGVYVIGGAPPSWEQTLLAITLPFDDCWISHGTAARVWALRFAPQTGTIEVLRPFGKHRRIVGVSEHRSRLIVPADLGRQHRIPVTGIGRTIVEISGRLDAERTGKVIDDAMRRHPSALEDVRACFARLVGGGRRRLQSVTEALRCRIPGYDPGESDLELSTLRTIIGAGLPIPVQQHRLVLNGKRARIDLAYPEEMVAIELQSWEHHGGNEAFHEDKARIGDLVADGWRAFEITSRHHPEDVVRRVSGALMHAAA